jgi:very-short-patch-repair endonuclease
MNDHYNAKLQPYAQKLRRDMTKEERHLWYDFLKQLPVTVHRQKIFGNYIADFYIAAAKLVIELDGSQHYEETNRQKDVLRDAYFQRIGCKVLRYSNEEINQRFAGVCEDILKHMAI